MENTFELFPKISKSFWRLPKIFQNFHKYFYEKRPARAVSPLGRPLMFLSIGGKINELFTGLWSVRVGKNCDLGLNMLTSAQTPQSAYSDLGPEASVSIFRPRSQFLPIRISQPVNNIYVFFVDVV